MIINSRKTCRWCKSTIWLRQERWVHHDTFDGRYNVAACEPDLQSMWAEPEYVIDADRLQRQREFSENAFGPGRRTKGVVEHIRKELNEIEADPTDVGEWIDIVILGLDGAWRAGGLPQQIIDGIIAKLEKNERREWPDWRTMSEDQAIEHVRGHED